MVKGSLIEINVPEDTQTKKKKKNNIYEAREF